MCGQVGNRDPCISVHSSANISASYDEYLRNFGNLISEQSKTHLLQPSTKLAIVVQLSHTRMMRRNSVGYLAQVPVFGRYEHFESFYEVEIFSDRLCGAVGVVSVQAVGVCDSGSNGTHRFSRKLLVSSGTLMIVNYLPHPTRVCHEFAYILNLPRGQCTKFQPQKFVQPKQISDIRMFSMVPIRMHVFRNTEECESRGITLSTQTIASGESFAGHANQYVVLRWKQALEQASSSKIVEISLTGERAPTDIACDVCVDGTDRAFRWFQFPEISGLGDIKQTSISIMFSCRYDGFLKLKR